MNKLTTIDLALLDNVTGGGSSTQDTQVGAQATVPKLGPVNLGVTHKSSTTDYAKCTDVVRGMPGATPSDLVKACGLPPSSGN